MKKLTITKSGGRVRLLAGTGLAALSLAAVASPAAAQSADTDEEDVVDVSQDEVSNDSPVITVTGSRIRLPNLESTEPTTTITSEFIEQRNFVNVADALNDLPQIRGSVTPDGGQSAFGQGVNFINNFGLGTNRTLTLVNGRRVISSNTPTLFGPGAPGLQVDLNVIPTALVKQIDIASTAGAPVYGSDAISGTVNIILDDAYEGLELNATSSITEEGDNFTYRLEGVYGTSFADGRGHLQVSSFYTEVNGVLQNQRQLFRDQTENEPNTLAQNRINPDLPLDVNDEDGVPAQVGFNDVSIFILSRFGVITGGPLGVSASPFALDGLSGTGAFAFNAAGELVPFSVGTRPPNRDDPTRVTGIRGIGGGDGFRFVDFGQLTSDLRRFGFNVFGNYDVTDNINVFTELQYYDARADELVQQPTFNTPFFGGFSAGLTFQDDNPFLTDQARGVLNNAGVTSFTLSRANIDIADLTGFAETELLRGVVGARGDFELFNQDWNWEASFTYGQTEVNDFRQDINAQNFINAVNVTTDMDGNIVCDADPANPVGGGGTPVADPNCVPFNFFGDLASAEARDYILSNNTSQSILEHTVFNVNVGGTLFELFDNPVAVNIGYEHRRESGSFSPSEFEINGDGRGAAITPISGDFNLDEVFGEIYVPIITPGNDAFIYSANVYGRGRYVDNTVNGGFFSWAAGGSVAPIEDIEIRGNFTRSFRAPAITELFLPQAPGFSFVGDLCFAAAIDGGPNPEARRRNCEAFLAAFPNINRPQLAAQGSVPSLSGGNPNLDNEQADSWSVGAILRPRFIPNLSITVDYIDISISDPIAQLSAAQINSACFDNDDFDLTDPANGNSFCSLIQRDANGEVIADANNPGVVQTFTNGNAIDYEGIQGTMLYSTGLDRFGLGGNLQLRGDLTVVLNRVIDITGIAPSRSDAEIGDPTWTGQFTVNYTEDNWGIGTVANYVGEQLFSRFNRTPDAREFDELDEYVTFDLNVFLRSDDDFRINFSVDNLFDRRCQEQNGFCIVGGINDAFGRTFSASVTKEF